MKKTIRHKADSIRYILTFLLAGTLFACQETTVYHSFRNLPADGWRRNDTLCFDVAVTDSQTSYQLSVEVRNLSDYPYQNLSVILLHETPDSLIVSNDTLHFILADQQGNWMGKGWGGIYQCSFPTGSINIRQAGRHRLILQHGLADTCISGIHDIGIKLTKKSDQTPIAAGINAEENKQQNSESPQR